MLYTLTMNPAIDMNVISGTLEAQKVTRTYQPVYTPNGKGVNVSFVLQHFGTESGILGFFGGFSGDYIVEEARKRNCRVWPVWIQEITRINIFLNDGEHEYKLVNIGPEVNEKAQDEMLKLIDGLMDLDTLVISGSLPGNVSEDIYDEIMKICLKKHTKVILDISSKKLKSLLKYKPFLIKPNEDEWKEIFGSDLGDEKRTCEALMQVQREGAQNILMTMGQEGAYFCNEKEIYFADTQPVKLLSSACAGDAALAAFLSIWLENPEKVEEAMKLSAATGANVAESNAIGDLKKVEEYRRNICVKKII